jgi:putative acetyltransferase
MIVRDEEADDRESVYQVVSSAFGQADEAKLVRDLESAGDTVISLVAIQDACIVGHVLLSKMRAPFRALALAPVSVSPEKQRRGIGSCLIRTAIDRARADRWVAIFVLGDPDYYRRFGFTVEAAEPFTTPYAGPHLMALTLEPSLQMSGGHLEHAPAFGALD